LTQYSYQDTLSGLQNENNTNTASYYAAFARNKGITVAPSYFANGIIIDGAEQFGGLAWTGFISNFINIPS
jgi:hypothetical protein